MNLQLEMLDRVEAPISMEEAVVLSAITTIVIYVAIGVVVT